MSVFLVMVLEEGDSLRLTNLNFPTQSALDMRSLLARVDVLFYWSGIPMFHTSKGNYWRKLVRVWEIRDKIMNDYWGERKNFWFDLSGGSKRDSAAYITNKLILVFIDFLQIKFAEEFQNVWTRGDKFYP